MSRRKLIAGNWKMHTTPGDAARLASALAACALPLERVDVAVFPPFVNLPAVAAALSGSGIGLGAQNVYWEPEGAFTGEISPTMLLTVGCQYVIIGHSERRSLFGESDRDVRRKVEAALAAGLTPLVCVGETKSERESGQTGAVIGRQIASLASGLADGTAVLVAYEPVWAIGTGAVATVGQAEEVHQAIRRQLVEQWGPAAESVRILYGGSVKPDNAAALLASRAIDGALVGGASLNPESFRAIVEAAV